jgi:hypothetical protein
MTNHLGNPINRIIRDITYTKGELLSQKSAADKAMEQLTKSANEFKNARSAIRTAEIRLTGLQQALAEKIDVSIDDIRAIRHWPKLPTTSYGKVIKELVHYLQAADEPKPTWEIIAHLVTKFEMPVGTNVKRREACSSIRRRLRKLVEKDVVVRYPEETVRDGHSTAYWQWVGPADVSSIALK